MTPEQLARSTDPTATVLSRAIETLGVEEVTAVVGYIAAPPDEAERASRAASDATALREAAIAALGWYVSTGDDPIASLRGTAASYEPLGEQLAEIAGAVERARAHGVRAQPTAREAGDQQVARLLADAKAKV